jgi:AcrR family transcriptional regulator
MAVQTRKEREYQEREVLFLETGHALLQERGFHGLTMGRIGEVTDYAKGTVYLHFGCKEELIVELGRRSRERRREMFVRAATFDGCTRERMAAVGEAAELFARLHPEDIRIWQLINAEAIIEKVPAEKQQGLCESEGQAHRVLMNIMTEAVEKGELLLGPGLTVEDMCFGVWAITEGGHAAVFSHIPFADRGIPDPFGSIMRNCHMLGDNYNWMPLSTEFDYEATRERVRREIFAEEAAQAGLL